MPLLQFTEKGIYCAQGDFYIDPWQPVRYAVITHAHSDHARWGSQHYLCHSASLPILQLRLGPGNYSTMEWNESTVMNGVKVSLHPAGHIIGSSQIRVEYKGEVWVVSGDYKLEHDGLSGTFEPVQCHNFITESTFGLPIYQWEPEAQIFERMQSWVQQNLEKNLSSILLAYSLGKAQRILPCLHNITGEVYVHGAVWNVHQALVAAGHRLPEVIRVTPDTDPARLKKAIVIAPPGADDSPWMRRFGPHATGICSGWMQVRGNRRRRNADAGFVLSDHADWQGLLTAVKATNASTVYVTHGFQSAFSRYLNEQGIRSMEVQTRFGEEEEEQLISQT